MMEGVLGRWYLIGYFLGFTNTYFKSSPARGWGEGSLRLTH